MSINDGGTAFPKPDSLTNNGDYVHGEIGMSLRDYFAAKSMQALIGARNYPIDRSFSVEAYKIADEMLKERGK